MAPKPILGLVLGLGGFFVPVAAVIQAQTTTQPQQPAASTAKKQWPARHKAEPFHSEGERVFAQNCARCHTAPDSFSPRISGTVVRHMRVRAQLSADDEQELLRFLNP